MDDVIKVGCTRLAWHLRRHFCGFASLRTNNGSGLAFVLGGEVGYFYSKLVSIISQTFSLCQFNCLSVTELLMLVSSSLTLLISPPLYDFQKVQGIDQKVTKGVSLFGQHTFHRGIH